MNRKEELCIKILQNSRTELYYHFPYLDGAFADIRYVKDNQEVRIHTDGEVFFFSEEFLISEFIREKEKVVRGYLHMLLHCLYLHPWIFQEEDAKLWDLACDIEVEALIEREQIAELSIAEQPLRSRVIKQMNRHTYSTQQIYRMLKEHQIEGSYEELESCFSFDDHHTWYETEDEKRGRMIRKWKHLAGFSGDRKGKSAAPGINPGSDMEVLDEYTKSRYDYRRFLKQFAVLREEVELDLESFDYIFYNLGMELYEDMPLIEPLEYKEVNRLEELVIAIDTSSSCTTEIVQQFLTETYQMLSQRENFFRKMKVYLIQCDTHIEDVVVIHSEEEWKRYSQGITIYGRGGTDFRPVFRYVEELQKMREIRNLKGLIYFTDGDGVFPKEKPPYETAFVFLKEKAKLDYVPAWAQVLLI